MAVAPISYNYFYKISYIYFEVLEHSSLILSKYFYMNSFWFSVNKELSFKTRCRIISGVYFNIYCDRDSSSINNFVKPSKPYTLCLSLTDLVDIFLYNYVFNFILSVFSLFYRFERDQAYIFAHFK